MPAVSEAERRAMGAAAAGKSNIGIPQSVGKEFIDADKGGKLPPRAPKAPGAPAAPGGKLPTFGASKGLRPRR